MKLDNAATKTTQASRYASLDALRGLTIMLMILVNNPGSWGHVYGPLRHAAWDGCTPTDLVFPFFLFIVGSAMYFSFAKAEYELSWPIAIRVLKRTAIIFAIGMLLHALSSYAYDSNFRIMGVLQRIAIAYAGAAFVILLAKKQTVILITSAVLLLAYWAVLLLFGGEQPLSLEGNAVRKLDLLILGAKQMYVVNKIPFDPEGLLSTIPSIVSIMIGFEVTRFLKSISNQTIGAFTLIVAGAVFVFAGWAWGYVWPVNKALWSGSFVVLTSGWAMIVLAILVLLMDVGSMRFELLQAYGMNPLFLYVLSGVWMLSYALIPWGDGNMFPAVFGIFLGGDEPSKAASFLFAASHVLLFGAIACVLYRQKIVIKV